jgi:hypothetical protein
LAPTAATILGAAKLTGRVGQFSVGALSAVTQQEQASRPDAPPADGGALTSFNVLRRARVQQLEPRRDADDHRPAGRKTRRSGRQQRRRRRRHDWRLGRRFSIAAIYRQPRPAAKAIDACRPTSCTASAADSTT